MKKRLIVVALAACALGASCNPVARCKATSDCGNVGICSGGFCSEFPLIQGDGGREAAEDVDVSDGGGEVDAGIRDFDAGTNGRP